MHKITVLEYALLASDVYNRSSLYDKKAHLPWVLAEEHSHLRPQYDDDMFARTYLHKTGNHIDAAVIAYRGTLIQDKGNLVDDYEIAQSEIPAHEKLAKMYYTVMFHQVAHTFGILPTLTGHSLGGAYAQLTAIENKPHPTTVVFNSPGVGQITSAPHLDHYDFIHNFNSRQGVINNDGKTVGSVKDLNVTEGDFTIRALGDTEHQSVGTDLHHLAMLPTIDEAIALYGVYEQHRIKDLIHAIKHNPKVAQESFA